ncbi:Z1 domain-containing protein [Chamaesiphon minutus]|uniref:Z1 domain-containing protein n=1 Tax=Chamaesiphon minutus (strain ATCC 27169 / PCC 6605) TaxID=1173020 RepID=K9UBS4_CHAP6|nr:Z1 domain-containing protein [Chamaesiphon minutus]AFY91876.1 Z1 domain-containing protein [Chamaesiphon minutus PCC 6605]
MSKLPIKTDGYCIDHFTNTIKAKIGDLEAEKLKNTACEIVQNCVDIYLNTFGDDDVGANGKGIVTNHYKGKGIPDGTTGLIYGKVQSGKTNITVATLALAEANNFRCFIVLTSDNTSLGKQTAERFKSQLDGGPIVCHWEEWKRDPVDFARSRVIPYIKDDGVVLISTKNVHHLDNLLTVLKNSGAKNVPTIIFDDEADNASLNTNEARKSKQGNPNISDSTIFEKIGSIRKEVINHIYLQITATPQSLLLQNLDHPCKPAFCAALPQPGDSYMGGDLFFDEESPYCSIVRGEEIEELKTQNGYINPGDTWNIPSGLKLALCCFFLGAVYKMESNQDNDMKYSFLAHICHKKVNHSNLGRIISEFILQLDKALRDNSETINKKEANKLLEQAYKKLQKTSSDLPPLENLTEKLRYKLRNAIPQVVNADNVNKELKYNPGMNILIGGNRLARGVTIEGLMVTYYGRDARQKTMDTVHQHARMFGYRQGLKDVTRLFLPQEILEDFRAIHEADEGMRQAIGDDLSQIKIQPVWIGRQLRATRSNVLNPAAIGVLTPGSAIFPRDPLWKNSDVEQHTEALDELLSEYGGDDIYHNINIKFLLKVLTHMPSHYCSGYQWDDTRIQSVLKAMNAEGVNEGILNVRRGNKGDGLELKNQVIRPWKGSGYAFSKWISKPRELYPDCPILVVMYQKGEKINGWECPLYLPTLILPKSKFAFMFNNMNEGEESE